MPSRIGESEKQKSSIKIYLFSHEKVSGLYSITTYAHLDRGDTLTLLAPSKYSTMVPIPSCCDLNRLCLYALASLVMHRKQKNKTRQSG